MSCRETIYIKLDKDIEVPEGESGIIICSQGALVVIDGDFHSISAEKKCNEKSNKKSKCNTKNNTKNTIGIDVRATDVELRVVNLNIYDVPIAIDMQQRGVLIPTDLQVIGSQKFVRGHGSNSVSLTNSRISKTKELFTGAQFDRIVLNNVGVYDIKKLITASGVTNLTCNNVNFELLTNAKGLFSSDQVVSIYTFNTCKISGGLRSGASLWSPSTTTSSAGLFINTEFVVRALPGGTSKTHLTRFLPIAVPIDRGLKFINNVVDIDADIIFDIYGNSSSESADLLLVSGNSFTSRNVDAVVSLTNFEPQVVNVPVSKSSFIFAKNSIISVVKQARKGVGLSITNSTGITALDNIFAGLKTDIEIDKNPTIALPSRAFIGGNYLQNSLATLVNNSSDVIGVPNTLFYNQVGAIGEVPGAPELVPPPLP